jgi:KUP system potassium uptake protein
MRSAPRFPAARSRPRGSLRSFGPAASSGSSGIVDYARTTGALNEHVIALTVAFEETPRIAESERSRLAAIGAGICAVSVRFGYIEIPDLRAALAQVRGLPAGVDLATAVFYGNRDLVVPRRQRAMIANWRLPLFSFLYRNAVKLVDRFNLPPEAFVEISRQIEI